jgi:hypothetical protein
MREALSLNVSTTKKKTEQNPEFIKSQVFFLNVRKAFPVYSHPSLRATTFVNVEKLTYH